MVFKKKTLRYKTRDLNTKSLFEASVVLSVERILYCLFDCDLCFSHINLFVGQPCSSWIWYSRWGFFQTLSTAPFVFIAEVLFSLDYSTDIFAWLRVLLSTPQAMAAAYLCCRLNFLIDILTFPLLLIYLHRLLVSKSCFFKIIMLFYLWKRITVFHSMFFMLLPRPSTVPVNHPKYCYTQNVVLFNPLCLSGGILFLGTPHRLKQCIFFYYYYIHHLAPKQHYIL